jgi:glycosyltransferase involved in cell wall biosynthesis
VKTNVKISVIIPALNEAGYLPTLLRSLQKQDFRDFEVIVADARSTDDTAEIARSFGARMVRGGSPAAGRNRGAAASRGDFLFFLDADVTLPRTFQSRAYAEMQKHMLDIATCQMKPRSNLFLDRVLHKTANLILLMDQHSPYPHLPRFCILISRRLFERIGGFDESVRLAEDHDLATRAVRWRRLRVLETTWIHVNVRRLRKVGRLNYAVKVIYSELYRAFRGRIAEDAAIRYEFGNFARVNTGSRLRKLERRINVMDRKYQSFRKRFQEKRLAAFASRQMGSLARLFRISRARRP